MLVPIDRELVPLVRRLWELGIDTRSSCQDYGESLTAPAPGRPPGDQRWIDFYSGRVWLKLATDHAELLMSLLSVDGDLRAAMSEWARPDSWLCVRPVVPNIITGRAYSAQTTHVFFPRPHLAQVVDVLAHQEAGSEKSQ